jgi:Tfp pilus assembly protein PilV
MHSRKTFIARLKSAEGTSLVEVIMAVTFVIIIAVAISLTFPKASKSQLGSRHRFLATGLATSKIEEIKKQVYDYIPTTPANAPYLSTTCDCAQADYSVWNAAWTEKVQTASTSFEVKWCIGYVASAGGGSWTPSCTSDQGYKNIRVRVSWRIGSEDHELFQEAMATRY